MLPEDPVILLSFMNMKLRDAYSNLEALFEDLDVSEEEKVQVLQKLESLGYHYNENTNQFV